MEQQDGNKVMAFDTLFSTNHIAMLKILLSCLDYQAQKSMAVYIKFLELQYTIHYYNQNPHPLCGCTGPDASRDLPSLCKELLPYCDEKEKKQIEKLCSLFQSMEMYREFSKTMETMKDMIPGFADMSDLFSSGDPSSGSSPDIMSLLINMLTPEQQEIFQMFGGNHNDK